MEAISETFRFVSVMFRRPLIWQALFCCALYGCFLVFPLDLRLHIINGIMIVMSATVIISYWEYIKASLESETAPPLHHQVVLGIALISLLGGVERLVLSIWRYMGQPPNILTSDMWGFLGFMYILALVLLITPRGAIDGKVPRSNYTRVFFSAFIGMVLASVIYVSVHYLHT